MTVTLDKKDLVSLVLGSYPSYELMSHFLIKDMGDYIGGFSDKWSWNNRKLNEVSEEVLWDIYQRCKNNWK